MFINGDNFIYVYIYFFFVSFQIMLISLGLTALLWDNSLTWMCNIYAIHAERHSSAPLTQFTLNSIGKSSKARKIRYGSSGCHLHRNFRYRFAVVLGAEVNIRGQTLSVSWNDTELYLTLLFIKHYKHHFECLKT